VSRRTKFSRKVALNASEEQVLAANVDAVFLVMSLNEDFNLRRLERYVTMAWESGAQPVIVLTKTDLCPEYLLRVLEVEAIAFGVPVHAISSLTGDGLDLIRSHLVPGRTIALLGSSGVGKSTLVNTLAGEELLATQTIRERRRRGPTHDHATASSCSCRRRARGRSPGMRELQLWESSDGLSEDFGTSRTRVQCRFSDCAHQKRARLCRAGALADGHAASERWDELQKLQRDWSHLERRTRQAAPGRSKKRWGQGPARRGATEHGGAKGRR
jgi:ribosome biogenesis GTPase